MSISTALTKRSAEQALMSPPPPPKKVKRPTTALEEEEYDEAISQIIKRDFFPGLVESDSQKEYLAALDSDNLDWIVEAGERLKAISTPGAEGRRARSEQVGIFTPTSALHATAGDTPRGWIGETPRKETRDDLDKDDVKRTVADTHLSLGDFQARYTSEDNESFYKLIDKSNKKRGEKYSWLWANNKIPTARQLEWKLREQEALPERAGQAAMDGSKRLISIEYVDKRKAAPEGWKAKPNNNFMFAPVSIEDSLETIQQRAEERSRMGPKEIVYENTHMPPPPPPRPGSGTVPASPSLSAVRDAIAGRPRISGSELGSSEAGAGGETPRVNGYPFVDSEEPEPEPASLSYGSRSTIDLGPGDATPNPFNIRKTGSRESLHHRMVDRLNEKKISVAKDGMKTPGRGSLTPAAQRLLGRAGSSTPKSTNLGEGWGATPRSKPNLAGVTPIRKH